MQVRVEIFHGKPGILQLAIPWQSLARRLKVRRHFHCVEWYLALAETFEKHEEENNLICFGVFSQNELVAVIPFRAIWLELANVKLRALQLASDAWEGQTARDLVMPFSLANSDFFQNFVHFLDQNDPNWDVISLRGIVDDSFAAAALKASSGVPWLVTPGGAWGRIEFMSWGSDGDPFARLSKGFRQNLRTAHNKLKAGDVDFVSTCDPDGLLALYPDFAAVESSGWKGKEGTSVLKLPNADFFLRRLISGFGPVGGCEIHLMKFENRTIAALFCIVVDDICYILKIGYDEAYEKASPGHLIVEHLAKTRGTSGRVRSITPYNAPPWFKAWKPNVVMEIDDAYVFRPSPRGHELANRLASALNAINPPGPAGVAGV